MVARQQLGHLIRKRDGQREYHGAGQGMENVRPSHDARLREKQQGHPERIASDQHEQAKDGEEQGA